LYIVISAIICFFAFHKLLGVREGSIIAALLVGTIIKFYNLIFDKIASAKCPEPNPDTL
jgi:uncharacterized membrane protein YczE